MYVVLSAIATNCSLSTTNLQWTQMSGDVTTNVIPWNVRHVRSSAVVREAHSPVQRSRTRSRAKVLNLRDMDFAWDDCTFSSHICWYWWHLGGFNKYHISSLSERWCFYCYIWSCRQVSLSSILFCFCNFVTQLHSCYLTCIAFSLILLWNWLPIIPLLENLYFIEN